MLGLGHRAAGLHMEAMQAQLPPHPSLSVETVGLSRRARLPRHSPGLHVPCDCYLSEQPPLPSGPGHEH